LRHLSFAGVLLLLLVPGRVPAGEPPPIVILGALDSETEPVAAELEGREPLRMPGIRGVAGTLGARRVVVAVAGVGKVNAAMTTALLLERFSPSAVIFSGVAGALDPQLQPGDVVVGEKLVQHDLVNYTEAGPVLRSVRNPLDGAANPIVFESSAMLLALARVAASRTALEPAEAGDGRRRPRVLFGTIATGDSFVSSHLERTRLREQLGADAVEMEGAAVAQVCHQRGVLFLVVRGLSDRAGNDASQEAQRHLRVSAGNAAQIATAVARQLAAERP
jgi:adenosylhomocysteine nucleosidase